MQVWKNNFDTETRACQVALQIYHKNYTSSGKGDKFYMHTKCATPWEHQLHARLPLPLRIKAQHPQDRKVWEYHISWTWVWWEKPWPHSVLDCGNPAHIDPLTPNDDYIGRTAPLTCKRCILYIYSTNRGTEYFKHGIYSPFFPLQNAVCFINLTYLFPELFTFYIQSMLKLKKIIPAPKG